MSPIPLILRRLLFASLLASSLSYGQTPAQKAPADIAADAFNQLRDLPDAKPGQARFEALAKSGFDFLAQYPTHSRADGVLNGLATYASKMGGKENAANRVAWNNFIILASFDAGSREGLTDEGRAALVALRALVACVQAREERSRDAVKTAREKIDELAQVPGSATFLVRAERSYIDVLKAVVPGALERHLQLLANSQEKGLVNLAKDETALLKARNEPLTYSFTATNGETVDLAKLRGKVVILVFWSTANPKLDETLAALKDVQRNFRKKDFAIITVACDKESARDAVLKLAGSKKIPGWLHFDGKGTAGDLANQLVIRWTPQGAILNKEGKLSAQATWPGAYMNELKKLLPD